MFLPVSKEDIAKRGISAPLDFICVSGDAYVDHPSFGTAIISRVIEKEGFTVGIIAQPNFRNDSDYTKLGKPKYGFFVGAGNLDSMVAHYTAAKRKRSEDLYSPGGKAGLRPDRATIVYTKALKRIYPDVPVIIGGLEASLRRFAHYDYWADKVLPSILFESGADILAYGMAERQTAEIARKLGAGIPVSEIRDVRGTCVMTENIDNKCTVCDSFEDVAKIKEKYALSVRLQYREQDPFSGKTVYQKHGEKYLRQNPPALPLSEAEMDAVYDLPYVYYYHPSYEAAGGIPAIEEVEFSITHVRGCFGACAFCALAFHQGRIIQSRSHASVIKEAERMVKNPRFKGYIHDVGGPTANFRKPSCKKCLTKGACTDRRCLAPEPCPNLEVDHSDYLQLLRELRAIKGVKKVFIRSGIRFDYLIEDKDSEFFRELVKFHISGQLKVAPEHVADGVLKAMGKPANKRFSMFKEKYEKLNREYGLKQFLVPYLMSSHPASGIGEAVALAEYLKKERLNPEQVQDFYPTPGTISSCMFYTGINPETMKKVYVPKTAEEKAMQRALLQYNRPKNYETVVRALKAARREDLIGRGDNALVAPRGNTAKQNEHNKAQHGGEKTVARTGGHAQSKSAYKFTERDRKNGKREESKSGVSRKKSSFSSKRISKKS